MKNKGFTLIELLAVIVILGIIGAIAFPTIGASLDKNKKKLYSQQVEMILDNTSKWVTENNYSLNLADATTEATVACRLELDELITSGFIKAEDDAHSIKDPITSGNMTGYVAIRYNYTINQYEMLYVNKDTNHTGEYVTNNELIANSADAWALNLTSSNSCTP